MALPIEEIKQKLCIGKIGQRIQFLLDNPHLCRRKLGEYNLEERETMPVYPNCYGTAMFLIGADRDFARSFPQSREIGDSIFIETEPKNFAFFPKNFDCPGALEPKLVKRFLEQSSHPIKNLNDLQPGDIASFTGSTDSWDYHDPVHVAIYLGSIRENTIVFHQDGRGNPFNFEEYFKLFTRQEYEEKKVFRLKSNFTSTP